MRRDDEREAEFVLQSFEQVEHALGRVGVEVTCRFVAEQQLRLLGQGPRDGDALRLASGQLCRQMIELRLQTDELEQRRRRERRIGLAVGELGGKGDVLERAEVRQQVGALEDVGDPLRAEGAAC